MHTLAFDGRMGASGDMVLGALVAAGADPAVLAPVEDALPVRYDVAETTVTGIQATTVTVRSTDPDPDDGGDPHAEGYDHDDGRSHEGHDHSHGDGHSHDQSHEDHPPAEGHGHTRSFDEVLAVVDDLAIPESVAADARATFELLAEAEAAVHGAEAATVEFHEVGADDAIADVVGAALLLDDLDVDQVVTTPLAAGGGEATFAHGTYPVPVPAVVELAARADWDLVGGPVDSELLTPTGAAILAHHADGVDALPGMRVDATGYGAGSKRFEGRPNVLRATLGTTRGRLRREPITVLETNLDDATPEILGSLQDSLADAGARDVTVVPTTMKKSRPGHLVKVVVAPEDAQRVARRLAEETGTLGVRSTGVAHRYATERRIESVQVAVDGTDHAVDVKVATDEAGERVDVSAEYDDAAAVARDTDLPVREVMRRAEDAFRRR
jgi:uncharacterized protein (TIGR00299 family) protein